MDKREKRVEWNSDSTTVVYMYFGKKVYSLIEERREFLT
jgi:hypothetical protein